MIGMDKSTHKNLSQQFQTNKQFKIAVTFLIGYNGISNVTKKNKKFCFAKSFTAKYGLIEITIHQLLMN